LDYLLRLRFAILQLAQCCIVFRDHNNLNVRFMENHLSSLDYNFFLVPSFDLSCSMCMLYVCFQSAFVFRKIRILGKGEKHSTN
jgi:hypothetical protein